MGLEQQPVNPERPEVSEACRAIVVDKAGQVLITERAPGGKLAGVWSLPGGKVDDDETPIDAMVRELDEELGVNLKLIFFDDSNEDRFSFKGETWHTSYYIAQWAGGLRINRDEISATAWVNPSNIGQYDIGFGHNEIIDQYWRSMEQS